MLCLLESVHERIATGFSRKQGFFTTLLLVFALCSLLPVCFQETREVIQIEPDALYLESATAPLNSVPERILSRKTRILTQDIVRARKRHAPRQWRLSGFAPKHLKFSDRTSGINPQFEIKGNKASNYFRAFFENELMQKIVRETNNYQQQNTASTSGRPAAWYGATIEELYVFFATTMLIGLNQKNRMKDYWSTDRLVTTPVFGELFTRDRYLSTLRYLHFADNNTEEKGKLRRIQLIMEYLRHKFQGAIIAWENLCVDESLMLWKSRLSFKQYIPTKRRRFGVKLFMLCDCDTKVVLNFIVYTGVETEIDNHPEVGLSGSVVLSLMENYLEKNHTFFVDNWFSSPLLFERRLEQKTKAYGTVRKNRGGMPAFGKLAKGQQTFQTTGKLLAPKWMDKGEVHMLITLHQPMVVATEKYDRETGQRIKKPVCIVQYNKCMRAVDQVDMQISFSDGLRKTIKWYKKLFSHLLDITVQKSYAMFQMNNEKNLELSEFRLQLVRELIEEYGSKRPQSRERPPIDSPLRLTARHFIAFIPGDNARKRCFFCSHTVQREKKRSDTRFHCPSCDVPLCNPDCFRAYHTWKAF